MNRLAKIMAVALGAASLSLAASGAALAAPPPHVLRLLLRDRDCRLTSRRVMIPITARMMILIIITTINLADS